MENFVYDLEQKFKFVPRDWDGKTCVLEIKTKQTEWAGFYLEHRIRKLYSNSAILKTPGRKFGKCQFDAHYLPENTPIDFKLHTIGSNNIFLNDSTAVDEAIEKYKSIVYVIFNCSAKMDTSSEFKKWHDEFKGEISDYRIKNIGTKSRMRKKQVSLKNVDVHIFNSKNIKHLKKCQEGMKNSNGNIRNAKYKITPKIQPDYSIQL